jgi:S-adenosylmethionine hydrolase
MAVVTLSTDIGERDFIIGAFKGRLLSLQTALQIADISHELSFAEAAYVCPKAFSYYAENAIHMALVNLFQFKPTHFLIAKYNKQFIFCPDNGILTMICKQKPTQVFKITIPQENPTINTIRYLSAFAEAANKLISDNYDLQFGEPFDNFIERYPMRPSFNGSSVEAQIIFIDKFENVVVNISRQEFEEYRQGRKFKINVGKEIISRIDDNYSMVDEDEPLAACFNSAEMLELSIKHGNMASLFGLRSFREENKSALTPDWFYQSVRIYFE